MDDFATHTLTASICMVYYLLTRQRSHYQVKLVLELLRVIVINDTELQATRSSHLILDNIEQRICILAVLSTFRTAISRYTELPTGTSCCTRDNHTHIHPIDTPSIRSCRDARFQVLCAISTCD